MRKHRFRKFLVLNGHGGNSDANRLVLRQEKEVHPNDVLAHATYFELIPQAISEALQGPSKRMTHGCEAETSLMLLLKPELVRKDKFRKDGMKPDPSITGLVSRFEELSEEGSIGYPAFAKAETGVKIFHAAVDAVVTQLKMMVEPLVMVEI
jgi:creatinine amidohydrolase